MILGFFFSRNMSIESWERLGLLDREKLIYEKHINNKNIKKIYWFTYGVNDYLYKDKLNKDIEIISMPKLFNSRVGKLIYSFLLVFIQKKYIKKCDILKTDQMDGSWSAVLSKIFYKKKLLVRTGFTLSIFIKKNRNLFKETVSILMEKFAYNFADYSTVSSQESFDYVRIKYKVDINKIEKINNYIDTEKFRKILSSKPIDRFIFIGRLEKQKNIFNLLNAIKELNIGLDIYGEGSLKKELLEIVRINNLDVFFKGKVKNAELPKILNEYKYYILPSYYEGMPKTLLEAMACGVCSIGTNAPGIKEIINDEINGYLIDGFDSKDIVKKIEYIIKQDNSSIVKESIEYIKKYFSLEIYVVKEKNIFKRLLSE